MSLVYQSCNILHIPEILTLILISLDQPNLSRTALVSRLWNTISTPLLYNSIGFKQVQDFRNINQFDKFICCVTNTTHPLKILKNVSGFIADQLKCLGNLLLNSILPFNFSCAQTESFTLTQALPRKLNKNTPKGNTENTGRTSDLIKSLSIEKIKLTWYNLNPIIKSTRNLTHLQLTSCTVNNSALCNVFQQLSSNLQFLNVSYTDIQNESLKEVSRFCPNIIYLELTGCKCVDDHSVISILKTCRKLRELHLGLTTITYEILVAIPEICVCLEFISIMDVILKEYRIKNIVDARCINVLEFGYEQVQCVNLQGVLQYIKQLTSSKIKVIYSINYKGYVVRSSTVLSIKTEGIEFRLNTRYAGNMLKFYSWRKLVPWDSQSECNVMLSKFTQS